MADLLIINNALPVEQFNPDHCALALLHTDKIPIHLGLISAEKYHSLTIKGYDQKPWEVLKALMKKKEINSLFISLNQVHFDSKIVEKHFQKFSLDDRHTTCITPICSLLSHHLNFEVKANVIFDLLSLLAHQNLIGKYYVYPEQQRISLTKYTQHDVLMYIKNLKT
ncbi:MAG: hypothetical protein ACK4GL_05445 [Flavobacteriales bacterium]